MLKRARRPRHRRRSDCCVLLPFLLLVALLIKIDSTGPVFFRQARVGLNGRTFRIFKFRTMVTGAYKMGSRLTTKRDPRVTRVGQILRWFKIDELPQLHQRR